jgi:hypothetical protein
LDIVYLRKYLNSMALTIRTQQKTAINIEFNFGLLSNLVRVRESSNSSLSFSLNYRRFF